MPKKLRGLGLAVIVALTIPACSKKSQKPPNPANPNDTTRSTTTTPKDSVTDVYICGMAMTTEASNLSQAYFWKNGTMYNLAQAATGSIANCITVSDTDVYIGGQVDNAAVYWKNGVVHNIGIPHDSTTCSAIAVIHDTVYAAVRGVSGYIGWPTLSFIVMVTPSGSNMQTGLPDNLEHA